jgi:hypothetical protein
MRVLARTSYRYRSGARPGTHPILPERALSHALVFLSTRVLAPAAERRARVIARARSETTADRVWQASSLNGAQGTM